MLSYMTSQIKINYKRSYKTLVQLLKLKYDFHKLYKKQNPKWKSKIKLEIKMKIKTVSKYKNKSNITKIIFG